MLYLDNTVPIIVDQWTFLTYTEYQAIEGYYYQSATGPVYGCTSNDGVWVLGGGTLPPGTAVDGGTGEVKGIVGFVFGNGLLNQMIQNIPLTTFIPGATSNANYLFGSNLPIIVKYEFTVHGLNTTTGNPPTAVSTSISVLKNYDPDFIQWELLGDEIYEIGKKPTTYF